MEVKPERKLNWWVDLVLFLMTPGLTLIVTLAFRSSEMVAPLVVFLPMPLAVVLSIRLAIRLRDPFWVKTVVGILLAVPLYFLMLVLSFFGCAMGGGDFNIH